MVDDTSNTRLPLRVRDEHPRPYQYLPLLESIEPSSAEIRLLTLLPGTYADDIHIKLHRTTLPNPEPGYEALSYVWGAEDNPSSVVIYGHKLEQLQIRQNLDRALRSLRYKEHTRTLWVDYICINQNDLNERNRQVRQMGQIYANAMRVIVWLGPEDDDAYFALDELHHLACNTLVNWSNNLLDFHTGWADTQLSKGKRSSAHTQHALVSLLNRPWFERVWVRQEICLAVSAVVACGNRVWPWKSLSNAIFVLHRQPETLTHIFGDVDGTISLDDRLKMIFRLCRISCQSISIKTSFDHDVLPLSRLRFELNGLKATDPRDRIYGLWSLMSNQLEKVELEPDYSVPLHTTFFQLVRRQLAVEPDFLDNIIHQCLLEEPTSSTSPLPSWVPDFSTNLPWNLERRGQNASSHMVQAEPLVRDGLNNEPLLHALARRPSQVEKVCSSTVAPVTGQADLCREMRGVWKMACDVEAFCGKYPDTRARLAALCETLLFGHVSGKNNAPTMFDEYARYFADLQEAIQGLEEFLIGDAQVFPWHRVMLAPLSGKAVFVATDGSLGIGPRTIRPKDYVSVLVGCRDLAILREVSDGLGTFQVVGPAFMPSLSYGGALLGPLPLGFSHCLFYVKGHPTLGYTKLERNELVLWDPRIRDLIKSGRLDWDWNIYEASCKTRPGRYLKRKVTKEELCAAGIDVEWILLS